ncbi:Dihydrolipoyllysine-residue acetyltransferase component of pyruvate dehydrogenase complex [Jeotgalibaca dankookensis]|uniref:Dihydrolipoamide acetyltransferase component of pyruvate dehydrogenase complex n=1 Tax=Jeotgalibaca dankookensis TaxID=708126 RepID=A0A1S6IRP9_9LACT|nr:dihydrolipoamide acetyltransferase family protein [Jeotgalibaca dankookensis]AQS54233.1 Dihydrolipoyllysine-residue acetyltransferase component of pyruvate dehydrogenase complex [Jeotgalibaca dankookensis]
MSIEYVKMPGLGESVTEASVVMWLVKPGDKVEKYDPLAEVISDKVSTEIPSNLEGTVKELLIELDEDVEIGTKIMSIEVEGDGTSTEPAGTAKTETDKEEKVTEEKSAPEEKKEKPKEKGGPRFSPAVMRLAQENNIDLADVVGTGKDGRITRKDVQNYEPSKKAEKEYPQEEPKEKPVEIESEGIIASSGQQEEITTTQPQDKAAQNRPYSSTDTRDEVVPASGVRKAIAKKMVQSVTEIPHAWVMVEADVTNIVKLRNQTKEAFYSQEGIKLSYFPFFVKAVVQALKKNPKMNTSWDNGNIIYHKDINVSIAVTTEDNLYVPVIHNADKYSLAGIASEINRLASDVRSNKLKSEDMQGGTFTVNNTGTLGSVQSMGIINHPQAAILQVESINKRLVPTEDGGFKTADMINLSLSIDHRILDGLAAGKFLKDVKQNLERYSNESDLY